MNVYVKVLLESAMTTLAIVAVVWVIWRSIRNAENPRGKAIKWAITLLLCSGMWYLYFMRGISWASVLSVFLAVPFALLMSIMWTRELVSGTVGILTNLIDGGGEQIKPAPLYSAAVSKRNRGAYREALWEIQNQLEKFPNDFTGLMMIAEIQAEDLQDIDAAAVAVQRIFDAKGMPDVQVADALNRLAEWQLKLTGDKEAARQVFEQVIQRFPGTPLAHVASQRMAHMCSEDAQTPGASRHAIRVTAATGKFMKSKADPELDRKQEDEAKEAKVLQLIKQLEQFPDDNSAREDLACLYALHYKRLDMAVEQMEQLNQQKNAP